MNSDAPLFLNLTKDEWGVVVPVMVAIIGLTTWLIGQHRDRKRKNFEIFLKFRDNFRTNENFVGVFRAFDDPAYDMLQIDTDHVTEMAAFFEELAVLVQSGIIPLNLAHYFFGWYVIQITEDERFTVKLNDFLSRDYWKLLYRFGHQLQIEDAMMRFNPDRYIRKLTI